ncbi:HRDC domain-containing protein [Dehalococcoidia bacterium]|nr:HRDC domain-containing protein [Dehalococcoidia bacterium]
MTRRLPPDTEIVSDGHHLNHVLESLKGHERIALDTESDSLFHYPEKVCLVQLMIGTRIYIIDPLSIEDMAPLGEVLRDKSIQKVMHSADYDIRSFDRQWEFRIENLFDTSIAAAFTGKSRLGLANVLHETLHVTIPKNKELQRSDWSLRPLQAEALEYAATDVRHLFVLQETLFEELSLLNRSSWVTEESTRLSKVRYAVPDKENAFFSIKGSRDLDERGLTVLKMLVAFREKEAIRLDRPPFHIISNAALISLAMKPSGDLSELQGIGRYLYPPRSNRLKETIDDAMLAPRVNKKNRPSADRRTSRRNAEQETRFKLMKEWRLEHSKNLFLDAGLLWPMASLERLAKNPKAIDEEMSAPDVREWQRNTLGKSLHSCVEKLIAQTASSND